MAEGLDYSEYSASPSEGPSDLEILGVQVTQRVTAVKVDFARSSWYYALTCSAFYLLGPIAMPIMILASRALRRGVSWFPRIETR